MAGKMMLRRGDRIVFLGDSITEQQLYTNYVESYLASRYPELGLTFFNAGWGGDTAPGGLKRLERDVLSLKPTVVTICYGMNDARYCAPREEILRDFAEGMEGMVTRLKEEGVRVVLLTPGCVDETRNPNFKACDYNHTGLRILADYVLKLARREKLRVCDIHRLMNEVDAKGKAADSNFTMVPDSVHPDPAGHLVMMFGLLQALGVPARREVMEVDAARGKAKTVAGVTVGRVRRTAHGCLFDLKLKRGGFFVEPEARKVLPFLPFQETFNTLKVKVRGLEAERYYFRTATLRSDVLEREALAAGYNLLGDWTSPPMQAAADVHTYTREKVQVYYKMWRMLGLKGVNGAYFNAGAHGVGRRAMPALDEARGHLLSQQEFTMNLVSTAAAGEPLTNGDFIGTWVFRGPLDKPYDRDFLGGEAAFTAAVPKLDGEWVSRDLDYVNPGDCLSAIFGARDYCSCYALTVIESPVEQTAELLLGSDDGFAVFWNGEMLASKLYLARGVVVDSDRLGVRLRKGSNVLLVKVSQVCAGWGLCARFAGLKEPVAARRP